MVEAFRCRLEHFGWKPLLHAITVCRMILHKLSPSTFVIQGTASKLAEPMFYLYTTLFHAVFAEDLIGATLLPASFRPENQIMNPVNNSRKLLSGNKAASRSNVPNLLLVPVLAALKARPQPSATLIIPALVGQKKIADRFLAACASLWALVDPLPPEPSTTSLQGLKLRCACLGAAEAKTITF